MSGHFSKNLKRVKKSLSSSCVQCDSPGKFEEVENDPHHISLGIGVLNMERKLLTSYIGMYVVEIIVTRMLEILGKWSAVAEFTE